MDYERIARWRYVARIGYREAASLFGLEARQYQRYEHGEHRAPQWLLDRIDSWNPDEIGRPVPTVTWTRGNPFKPRRRR